MLVSAAAPLRTRPSAVALVLALAAWPGPPGGAGPAEAQRARISQETRTLDTYPFGEANPVPILARDPRLYPYHSFEGYAATSEPREWKVVRMENDWIEVFVLPEVGGKVWGAVVKETGHEFIYRNEVLKFRNIALRGPWTSGGIEFNFGVIGHTPATATPVDYLLRENPDGSVSCIVGAMDLPSRTHWRVEIRLPADRAWFETRVVWYNPTPLEQPYYNWMTGAAFARDDLEFSVPGDAFLEHSGQVREWPLNPEGRDLHLYRNNTFGSHKSYHVVGEVADFFGGYYRDAGYGFGHWAPHEDMPGQKLWLWALSREGGVWEDLLTDSDGQYVEFQAGRLLVQYSPGEAVNPITQVGFDPLSASRWSETWFPVEGLGGLTWASREGALHLEPQGGEAHLALHAFRAVTDTVRVWSGGRLAAALPVALEPLEPFRATVAVEPGAPLRIEAPALELLYKSDPTGRRLSRPFDTDPDALAAIPEVDRRVFQARERMKAREYGEARRGFEEALRREPWHREALLGAAELDYRAGKARESLARLHRVLALDAYDPQGNYLAGIVYRDLGRAADARDALGWAARSTAFRSAAYAQLGELMIREGDLKSAERYARLSLDYDRHGIPGWRVLAVVGRLAGDRALAREAKDALLQVDPLHHFVAAERYLASPDSRRETELQRALGGEYPDQSLLELVVGYAGLGRGQDGLRLLDAGGALAAGPVAAAWMAYLREDPAALPAEPGVTFAFPYRRETLPVLAWAAASGTAPGWRYLLALNLWAVDRRGEALEILDAVDEGWAFAPFHVARAQLAEELRGEDPVPGLRRAVATDAGMRVLRVILARALLDRGRWEEALSSLDDARARFPDDFNLALLQARALLLADRGAEAAAILDRVRVLPSENARESHLLYALAHAMTGMDALEAGDARAARESFLRALEWPERLGQGRPYEPDERLVHYLLALAERELEREEAARSHFRAAAEGPAGSSRSGPPSVLDLVSLAARRGLGEPADLEPVRQAPEPGTQDLEGRLVHRALRMGGVR